MKKKKKSKYVFMAIFALGVLTFIGGTLNDFYSSIQRRVYDLQIESMKNLSMQGSAVIEKNMEGLVNTLYGLAENLDQEDLTGEANMNMLQTFLGERDWSFQRLAIADAQGNAFVTGQDSLNISDRQFFIRCMNMKKESIEIRNSELVNKRVCLIGVPIMPDHEEPVGVLYGIMEMGVFNIYSNTLMENETQYIQIIEPDGDYIVKEETSVLGDQENLFDGLASVDSSVSVDEIKESLYNENQVFTEISNGTARETVYFTPLSINNWCVVTVMNAEEVLDSMKFILGNDVYYMIIQVIVVVLLLCLLILFYSWQDNRRMREYNERLVFDENIFKIASEKTGFAIMSYSVNTKELRFINNELRSLRFPRLIENAPKNFFKYIPEDEELERQITAIFENMETETGKREVSVIFRKDGKDIHIRVQLTSLTGTNGELRQCVGVIEDVTEQKRLRDKADRDSLTGLYNRAKAAEIIENSLKGVKPRDGCVHAFLIMDLDNFKVLNDTLGHQVGDRALQDVAKILRQHFREYDIVGRLGGDEFLVFLKDIPKDVINRNINSLLKKLTLMYDDRGRYVQITASAGLALVSGGDCEFKELYRKADKALYEVKQKEKNNFKIYGQEDRLY